MQIEPEIITPMRLKELLDKVDFDTLAPFIEKTEGRHLDSIYAYREAYDILWYMKPSENFKGEARVEWSGEEYGDMRRNYRLARRRKRSQSSSAE